MNYLKWFVKELGDILLNSDIKFALVVLGLVMNLWGAIGLFHQADLVWFSSGFAFELHPWIWSLVHMLVGCAIVHCAVHDLPPGRSLLLGWFIIMVWTLVLFSRPNSSISSGISLTVVIIFMAGLLIQRSGRP